MLVSDVNKKVLDSLFPITPPPLFFFFFFYGVFVLFFFLLGFVLLGQLPLKCYTTLTLLRALIRSFNPGF